MTLQEAKDQIAKTQGFADWNNINDVRMENNLWPLVSRVYAGSKWDDACEARDEQLFKAFRDNIPNIGVNIDSVPKPEFNP